VAGLNVADLDLGPDPTVTVRRTRKRTPAGWVTARPKSDRSARTVPIHYPDVTADLQQYLNTHPRRTDPTALLLFGRLPGGNHITPDPDRPWDPGTFYKRTFIPATKATGLHGARFHDLRHTAASLWATSGIEMFLVSRWLGPFQHQHHRCAVRAPVPDRLGARARAQAALRARQEQQHSNVIRLDARRTS
jgi:integrase